MKNRLLAVGVLAALLSTQAEFLAQEPAPTAKPVAKPAAAPGASTPLKLLVTVSRYQAEKKISSLPYSLSLTIDGPRVSFRMGAQVPYATSQANDTGKTPSYSYRDVGVRIDVTGQLMVEPGLYRMNVAVEDSSLSSSNQIQGAPTIVGVPIFRNFSTNGVVILRDGQSAQLTTAADPITGETMRVDVTLTVVK